MWFRIQYHPLRDYNLSPCENAVGVFLRASGLGASHDNDFPQQFFSSAIYWPND